MKNKSHAVIASIASFLLIIGGCYYIYLQRDRPGLIHLAILKVGMKTGLDKLSQEGTTMSSIWAIHKALWSHAMDHGGRLPRPPVWREPFVPYTDDLRFVHTLPAPKRPWPIHIMREVERLRPLLEPKYIDKLPTLDYWGNPLYFDISEDREHLIVVSLGSDGIPDKEYICYFEPRESHRDIACFDGVFIGLPAGLAR